MPSCSAVLNNLLVWEAVLPSGAVADVVADGVADDVLLRLFGVYGFSAFCLAKASSICRLMASAVLSFAMVDELGTGVQGREGSFDACVLRE